MFEQFQTNLRILRDRKKLSIYKLSKEVDISKNCLRAMQYGFSEPKASQLIKLCDYFQIKDIREFLTKEIA